MCNVTENYMYLFPFIVARIKKKKKKKKIIAREKRNTSVRNFESRFNREEGEEEEKSA